MFWAAVFVSLTILASAARYDALRGRIGGAASSIKPTHSGYVKVDKDGSSIYYAYYESQTRADDIGEPPIVLWLQGGPGCASTFGGFYELGPWSVTPELGVQRNIGAWNRIFGLLLMDQPVGTGYSLAANGSSSIPRDEMAMAAHLYAGLQAFFGEHHWLSTRPLLITGESYAGKYVPSIAHYILQVQEEAALAATTTATTTANSNTAAAAATTTIDRTDSTAGASSQKRTAAVQSDTAAAAAPPRLLSRRPLPPRTPPPVFRLAGVAVGNGLTDPRAQTQTLAAAAYYAGLLPPALRDEVAGQAAVVVALIDEGNWVAAHDAREKLRSFITNVTGLGTMFDTRRTEEYDPTKSVDRFLNLDEVKEAMRAKPGIQYESCSPAVADAMAGDVMRSVKALLPDVLRHIPVLLYQGQYDILDGVASVTSWLSSLEWEEQKTFAAQKGQLWYLGGQGGRAGAAGAGRRGASVSAATVAVAAAARRRLGGLDEAGVAEGAVGSSTEQGTVAGWWRAAGRLTHVVVYRAGHMVPHDQPQAAQQMIESWVLGALEGKHTGPGAA